MKFCLLTLKGEEILPAIYDLPELKTFNHFFDYAENALPEVFALLQDKKFSICFLKTAESSPILWKPGVNLENFSSYEYLYFVEKVEGEAIVSSVAAVIAATIASVTGAAVTATAVVIAANILAYALVAGIMYGIGQIMQALSPSQSTDPQAYKKSLIFADNQTITTQGSPIPWVLGECLAQGVIIGRQVNTYDFVSGDAIDDPELPNGIPTVTKATLPSAAQSRWYKLVS